MVRSLYLLSQLHIFSVSHELALFYFKLGQEHRYIELPTFPFFYHHSNNLISGVLRTQLNIYDEAFLKKIINS